VQAIKWLVPIALVPFLCGSSALPQTGGQPAKEDDLYSMALFASIAEMQKSWGSIDDSDSGSRIRTDYHHMLVEKDAELTDGLPTQVGDFHVDYLDRQTQIDRYKKVRKEFSILRIFPMKNDGSRLTIDVTIYYVEYAKGKLMLGLSDWSDVEFHYDCETQKYVISGVKLGGI